MLISKNILACIIVLISINAASAEPVFVRSRSGKFGQGWLFGSPQTGRCWIAVPAHVIRSPETGTLDPFHYTDMQGISGETDRPVSAETGSHASAADNESQDLAFAQVTAGRQDGDCQSRLGVPTYRYESIVRRAQSFSVMYMLATSYRTFPASLAAGAVDQYGGAIIEFRISDKTAAEALQQGISGAIIATNDGKESVPVAMTLRIKSDTTTLRAMRYDYIKERFASAEVQARSHAPLVLSKLSIPYVILGITNTPLPGDTGVTGLQSANGCWRSEATPGARTVDLTINVNATTQRIKAVRAVTAPCGSAPLKYWVDQRIKEDAPWEYVAACEQPADSSVDCRIDLATPRQLRFRFDARTPVAINALLLQ